MVTWSPGDEKKPVVNLGLEDALDGTWIMLEVVVDVKAGFVNPCREDSSNEHDGPFYRLTLNKLKEAH